MRFINVLKKHPNSSMFKNILIGVFALFVSMFSFLLIPNGKMDDPVNAEGPQDILFFSAINGNISAVDGDSNSIESGSRLNGQVVLTATANSGYVFKGWRIPNGTIITASVEPYTLGTVGDAYTLSFQNWYTSGSHHVAIFGHRVNFSANDHTIGSVWATPFTSGNPTFGEEMSVTAKANVGFNLLYYTVNGTKVETSGQVIEDVSYNLSGYNNKTLSFAYPGEDKNIDIVAVFGTLFEFSCDPTIGTIKCYVDGNEFAENTELSDNDQVLYQVTLNEGVTIAGWNNNSITMTNGYYNMTYTYTYDAESQNIICTKEVVLKNIGNEDGAITEWATYKSINGDSSIEIVSHLDETSEDGVFEAVFDGSTYEYEESKDSLRIRDKNGTETTNVLSSGQYISSTTDDIYQVTSSGLLIETTNFPRGGDYTIDGVNYTIGEMVEDCAEYGKTYYLSGNSTTIPITIMKDNVGVYFGDSSYAYPCDNDVATVDNIQFNFRDNFEHAFIKYSNVKYALYNDVARIPLKVYYRIVESSPQLSLDNSNWITFQTTTTIGGISFSYVAGTTPSIAVNGINYPIQEETPDKFATIPIEITYSSTGADAGLLFNGGPLNEFDAGTTTVTLSDVGGIFEYCQPEIRIQDTVVDGQGEITIKKTIYFKEESGTKSITFERGQEEVVLDSNNKATIEGILFTYSENGSEKYISVSQPGKDPITYDLKYPSYGYLEANIDIAVKYNITGSLIKTCEIKVNDADAYQTISLDGREENHESVDFSAGLSIRVDYDPIHIREVSIDNGGTYYELKSGRGYVPFEVMYSSVGYQGRTPGLSFDGGINYIELDSNNEATVFSSKFKYIADADEGRDGQQPAIRLYKRSSGSLYFPVMYSEDYDESPFTKKPGFSFDYGKTWEDLSFVEVNSKYYLGVEVDDDAENGFLKIILYGDEIGVHTTGNIAFNTLDPNNVAVCSISISHDNEKVRIKDYRVIEKATFGSVFIEHIPRHCVLSVNHGLENEVYYKLYATIDNFNFTATTGDGLTYTYLDTTNYNNNLSIAAPFTNDSVDINGAIYTKEITNDKLKINDVEKTRNGPGSFVEGSSTFSVSKADGPEYVSIIGNESNINETFSRELWINDDLGYYLYYDPEELTLYTFKVSDSTENSKVNIGPSSNAEVVIDDISYRVTSSSNRSLELTEDTEQDATVLSFSSSNKTWRSTVSYVNDMKMPYYFFVKDEKLYIYYENIGGVDGYEGECSIEGLFANYNDLSFVLELPRKYQLTIVAGYDVEVGATIYSFSENSVSYEYNELSKTFTQNGITYAVNETTNDIEISKSLNDSGNANLHGVDYHYDSTAETLTIDDGAPMQLTEGSCEIGGKTYTVGTVSNEPTYYLNTSNTTEGGLEFSNTVIFTGGANLFTDLESQPTSIDTITVETLQTTVNYSTINSGVNWSNEYFKEMSDYLWAMGIYSYTMYWGPIHPVAGWYMFPMTFTNIDYFGAYLVESGASDSGSGSGSITNTLKITYTADNEEVISSEPTTATLIMPYNEALQNSISPFVGNALSAKLYIDNVQSSNISPFITIDNSTISANTVTGYTFDKFTLNGDDQVGTSLTFAPTDVVCAYFTTNTYTIAFNGNGGTGTMDSKACVFGKDTLSQNAFTRDGYTFYAWSRIADGSALLIPDNSDISVFIHPEDTEGTPITLYAVWSCVANFDSDGGSAVPSQTVIYNGHATMPDNPIKAGSSFGGWYTALNGGGELFDFDSAITESITLYAAWGYNVIFNTDGGSEIPNQAVLPGACATAPTNPTKVGYTFDNWYTQQNGAGEQFSFETQINNDTQLYANWTLKTYTIEFNSNGGVGDMQNQTDVNIQSTLNNNAFTREGFVFVGWTRSASTTIIENGSNVSDFLLADDVGTITLYAVWSCVVNFDSDGGSAVSPQNVAYNGQATMPDNPTKSGFTFIGWYTALNGGGELFDFDSAITGSITLYAAWGHEVTFNSTGGSEVPTQTILSGANAETPSQPTYEGFTFAGWFTAENGGGVLFNFENAITENTSLYAAWECLVTFDSTGGSEVTPQTVVSGTLTTAPTNPTKVGYTFDNWYTEENGAGDMFVFTEYAINEAITLYAKWIANTYTVVFNSNAADSEGTMDTMFLAYDSPSNLTENSFSRSNYRFAGWSINDSDVEPTYVDQGQVSNLTSVANGEVTLFAIWVEQVTLTIEATVRPIEGSASEANLNTYATVQVNGEPYTDIMFFDINTTINSLSAVCKTPGGNYYEVESWYNNTTSSIVTTSFTLSDSTLITLNLIESINSPWDVEDVEVINQVEPISGVYSVGNIEQLVYALNDINNQPINTIISLTADIIDNNPNKLWVPIGSVFSPFVGTFEGNGYSISGLKIRNIDDGASKYYGVFGVVAGTIKNLLIKDIDIDIDDSHQDVMVGALAGVANDGAMVSNVSASGVIDVTSTSDCTIGGLLGSSSSSMEDIYSDVDIIATGETITIGGLAGVIDCANLEYAYAHGSITATANQSQGNCAGGLVGYMAYGQLNNSVSLMTITTGVGSCAIQIGSIAGQLESMYSVKNNYKLSSAVGNDYAESDMAYTAPITKSLNFFKSKGSYTNSNNWFGDAWDMDAVWTIIPAVNGSLPMHRNNIPALNGTGSIIVKANFENGLVGKVKVVVYSSSKTYVMWLANGQTATILITDSSVYNVSVIAKDGQDASASKNAVKLDSYYKNQVINISVFTAQTDSQGLNIYA